MTDLSTNCGLISLYYILDDLNASVAKKVYNISYYLSITSAVTSNDLIVFKRTSNYLLRDHKNVRRKVLRQCLFGLYLYCGQKIYNG